jgi:hypothetical protein
VSDTCSVTIIVLKKDYEELLRRIGREPDAVDSVYENTVEALREYVDNGAWDEFKEAGEAGLVFLVDQGRGNGYNEGMWVSCGDGEPVFVDTDSDGYPVVRVSKYGPLPDSLENARKYFEKLEKAQEILGLGG